MTGAQKEAYIKLCNSGKREKDADLIFDLLNGYTLTLNDLSELLQKPKYVMSARCSEMEEKGLIRKIKQVKQKGKSQTAYGVTPADEVHHMSIVYRQKRIDSHVKTLKNKYGMTLNDFISSFNKVS